MRVTLRVEYEHKSGIRNRYIEHEIEMEDVSPG